VAVARATHEIPSTPETTRSCEYSKRTKPRSPSSKLRLLAKSISLEGDALIAYCHTNGVTVEELLSWRDLALSGIELSQRDGLGITRKEHDKKVAQLEKELRRKNDALAEAAALIVLQKKISDHLGDEK
jgi:transposase